MQKVGGGRTRKLSGEQVAGKGQKCPQFAAKRLQSQKCELQMKYA